MADDSTVLHARMKAEGEAQTGRAIDNVGTSLDRVAGRARNAKGQFEGLGDATDKTEKRIGALERTAQRLDGSLRSARAGATALLATLGAASLIDKAFGSYATYERNAQGIALVSDSLESFRRRWSAIQTTAALPGINEDVAAKAQGALELVGLSEQLSSRIIRAFANVNNISGGGPAEFSGLVTALTQAVGKGKLMSEEFQQMAERAPIMRRLLKDAFGTAEIEDVQGMGLTMTQILEALTAAAEKIPKALGGAANSVDNLKDRADRAARPLGAGIAAMFLETGRAGESLLDRLERAAFRVGRVLSGVGKSGIVGDIGVSLFNKGQGAGQGLEDGLVTALSYGLAFIKDFPETLRTEGEYLSGVFSTTVANLRGVFQFGGDYLSYSLQRGTLFLQEQFDNAMGKASGIGRSVLDSATSPIRKALDTYLAYRPMVEVPGVRDALQGLRDRLQQGVDASGARADGYASSSAARRAQQEALKAPELQSYLKNYPDVLNIKDPFGSAAEIQKKIRDGMKGFRLEPSSLIFGNMGGASEGGAAAAADTADTLLSQIERNTKDTAERLRSNGVLAKLGVTPGELQGPGNNAWAPTDADYQRGVPTAQLTRALQKWVGPQRRVAKMRGGPA
jgi:tape measure domain-containing protein